VTEAERLHTGLYTVTERLAGVLEEASFEQREGYMFTAFPTVPLPSFNGVWADTDAAAEELADALAEVEEMGLPFGVTVRSGRTPAVEEAARRLGLTSSTRVPGMAATPGELRGPESELEVLTVETADGLAQALAVAATGFGAPPELLAPIYMIEVSELDGIEYYLGRVDACDVSTAVGYNVNRTVGIFNVATPEEYRGRGYGAALTAHAAREGFSAGADLAWLQSSSLGESVYRRLGFREVETYTLLTRAPEASASS
jgi:ribosomal protein S18 acetylase RimI-like enzyme